MPAKSIRRTTADDVPVPSEESCSDNISESWLKCVRYKSRHEFFRTLLILLLCAVLPISGLAASGMAGEYPMHQTMSRDDGMSVAMPGCDSMKSTSTEKAKGGFCKVNAQCQFGSLYYPTVTATVSHPPSVGSRVVFHYAQALSIREPGSLWRPPRAI